MQHLNIPKHLKFDDLISVFTFEDFSSVKPDANKKMSEIGMKTAIFFSILQFDDIVWKRSA